MPIFGPEYDQHVALFEKILARGYDSESPQNLSYLDRFRHLIKIKAIGAVTMLAWPFMSPSQHTGSRMSAGIEDRTEIIRRAESIKQAFDEQLVDEDVR